MSQQLVDSLNKQVEQKIHGEGRDQILAQLEQDPTAKTLGTVTYEVVMAVDTQAAERGAPVDLDVLMGVATETIDMLIEIMQAMGIELVPAEMQEEALLNLVMLHMQAVEGDPEQKAAAEELLIALDADGTLDSSMEHINEKADASPEQMAQAGLSMGAPKQKPLAAGVKQGLMNQGPMQ